MTTQEIKDRVESFERWHYEFDLKGVRTAAFDPRYSNRHKQREDYLMKPVEKVMGGRIKGRVLDLGCNAGYWSLQAINRGADFVLGIDGRQMHVDQANLVFEVNEIDKNKYQFVRGNLYDIDLAAYGEFDLVMCLGLIYHVNKPFELIERIAKVNTDLLLIDTTLAALGGSYWQTYREGLDLPTNAVDYEVVLRPTKQAVFDLAATFGYETRMIKPQFTSYEGARDYRLGTRRAFLCSKKSSLAPIAGDAEHLGTSTHLKDTLLSLVGIGRRLMRRQGFKIGPST